MSVYCSYSVLHCVALCCTVLQSTARIDLAWYTYLHMHIHVYICTYTCTYAHTRVHMSVHVYTYIWVCAHCLSSQCVLILLCVLILSALRARSLRAHTRVHMSVHVYTYIWVCAHCPRKVSTVLAETLRGITYGVATITRFLKIILLFWQKSRIKETIFCKRDR